MNWLVWRLVMAPRLSCTLSEVMNVWSIDDVMTAHDLLDAFAETANRPED